MNLSSFSHRSDLFEIRKRIGYHAWESEGYWNLPGGVGEYFWEFYSVNCKIKNLEFSGGGGGDSRSAHWQRNVEKTYFTKKDTLPLWNQTVTMGTRRVRPVNWGCLLLLILTLSFFNIPLSNVKQCKSIPAVCMSLNNGFFLWHISTF